MELFIYEKGVAKNFMEVDRKNIEEMQKYTKAEDTTNPRYLELKAEQYKKLTDLQKQTATTELSENGNTIGRDSSGNILWETTPEEIALGLGTLKTFGVRIGDQISDVNEEFIAKRLGLKDPNEIAQKLAAFKHFMSTMVYGRIPGQSFQSMANAKVVALIPDRDNVIQVPTKRLFLEGSDKDIDVENLMMLALDDVGIVGWHEGFNGADKSTWSEEPDASSNINGILNYITYNMALTRGSVGNSQLADSPISFAETRIIENKSPRKETVPKSQHNPASVATQTRANSEGKSTIGIFATAIKVLSNLQQTFSTLLTDVSNGDKKVEELDFMKFRPFEFGSYSYSLKEKATRTGSNVYKTIANLQIPVSQVLDKLENNPEFEQKFEELVNAQVPAKQAAEELIKDFSLSPDYDILLSELLSAATDNAKELILEKLNSNLSTSGYIASAIALGVPLNDAIGLFLNADVEAILAHTESNIFENSPLVNIEDLVDTIIEMRNLPAKERLSDENKKRFQNVENIFGANKFDEPDIKVLLDLQNIIKYGEEFRLLGGSFGVNQGLSSSAYDKYKFISKIESYIKNIIGRDVDLIEILREEPTLNEFGNNKSRDRLALEKELNNNKVVLNVLYLLDSTPHFKAYFTGQRSNIEMMKEISYKAKATKKIADLISDPNGRYYTKDKFKVIKEQTFKAIESFLDELVVSSFLKGVTENGVKIRSVVDTEHNFSTG